MDDERRSSEPGEAGPDDTSGHITVEFDHPDDEQHIRELARGRGGIRIVPDDSDTEGHLVARGAELRVRLLDDDDTEGHAISLHFPSAREADQFRRRLIASGVIMSSLVVGGAGVALTASSGAESGIQAGAGAERQAMSVGSYGGADRDLGLSEVSGAGAAAGTSAAAAVDPVTGRPAGRGALQGVDAELGAAGAAGAAAGAASAIDPATERPERSGPLRGE